jgi:predicted RNA-binding protein YlxR (DUF448 family)
VRVAVSARRAAGEGDRTARAVIDAAGTMPGRGAYLCRGGGPGEPDVKCLELADRRGGIARALRVQAKLVESVTP